MAGKSGNPSKGQRVSSARARSKTKEGINKAQEMADRFQQSVFVRGLKGKSSPTGAYIYKRKDQRTPGESTPQARIADRVFGSYGQFPRPKPRPNGE